MVARVARARLRCSGPKDSASPHDGAWAWGSSAAPAERPRSHRRNYRSSRTRWLQLAERWTGHGRPDQAWALLAPASGWPCGKPKTGRGAGSQG